MFVVTKNQVEDISFIHFENEMVSHIKEYFPNHFIMMHEVGARNSIRYAYTKAKNYGITTQRNVCLYLNSALILGSNFDTDPQYPWVQTILNENSSPNVKSDKLSDATLEEFGEISGPKHIYLNRALVNIHEKSDEILQKMKVSDLKFALENFKIIFPKKYEIIGEVNLNQLIKYGINGAIKYGIKSEPNILIYLTFMFLMGSGFDTDPQFSWSREILTDSKITDSNMKTEVLYKRAINNIGNFLSQYTYQVN